MDAPQTPDGTHLEPPKIGRRGFLGVTAAGVVGMASLPASVESIGILPELTADELAAIKRIRPKLLRQLGTMMGRELTAAIQGQGPNPIEIFDSQIRQLASDPQDPVSTAALREAKIIGPNEPASHATVKKLEILRDRAHYRRNARTLFANQGQFFPNVFTTDDLMY